MDKLNVFSEVCFVHAAALYERVHEGGVPGSLMSSVLKPVSSSEGVWPEATLDGIVADFQKPACKELAETLLVIEQIVGGIVRLSALNS